MKQHHQLRAVATINVNLTTTDSNTKTMSAGTTFSTTVDGTDYQFVTIEINCQVTQVTLFLLIV